MLALATFALVMSITPGPNNLMLLSSGARFGLRRTLPHLFGVTSGFLGLIACSTAGVGALVLAYPTISSALSVACTMYLLWLAWQLLRSGPIDADNNSTALAARPLSWLQATFFQLANPKTWAAAVTMVSLGDKLTIPVTQRVLVVCLLAAAVNVPCTLVWTVFGAAVRQFLRLTWVSRSFNVLMAVLVAATAVWMLEPLLRTG